MWTPKDVGHSIMSGFLYHADSRQGKRALKPPKEDQIFGGLHPVVDDLETFHGEIGVFWRRD